jgi:alpha-glucosidase
MDDALAFIDDVHEHGLRILLDIVPNHTSDQHPWFQEALAAPPGSPARARYIFRDGKGRDGDQPPTDWPSVFGGPAWTRVTERDGRPGQWFLHLFAPEQPDLDWSNAEVADEFDSILRFWYERGRRRLPDRRRPRPREGPRLSRPARLVAEVARPPRPVLGSGRRA